MITTHIIFACNETEFLDYCERKISNKDTSIFAAHTSSFQGHNLRDPNYRFHMTYGFRKKSKNIQIVDAAFRAGMPKDTLIPDIVPPSPEY